MPAADEWAGGRQEDAVRFLMQVKRAEFLPKFIMITNLRLYLFQIKQSKIFCLTSTT